jgi:hypothetical protein
MFGRAWRDVREVMIGTLTAAVVLGAVGSFVSAQIKLPSRSSSLVKGLVLAAGFVAAAALTIVVVFLGCWLTVRRRHWATRVTAVEPDQITSDSHSLVWLTSKHWHPTAGLYCFVRKGAQSWRAPYRYHDTWLAPGSTVGVEFPRDFLGAKWPHPGRYRVAWLTDVPRRTKPLILSRALWKVEKSEPPVAPSADEAASLTDSVVVSLTNAEGEGLLPEAHHLVSVLRRDHTEQSHAEVIFVDPARFPLAKKIADVFELAGWEVNFNSQAQQREYLPGVEVHGYNKHLVDEVVSALRAAGCPKVVERAERHPTIGAGHPKHLFVQNRINVSVGYL